MNSDDKLAAAVTAALNARVAEGEDVRYYVESSLQSDEELVRELVAEEVVRSAILAADAILHPPVEGELAEVYEDSTGARFIHQTRNVG